MAKGFIKLDRKVLENPHVMKDAETLAIYVWLCKEAAWGDKKDFFEGEEIVLHAGQIITGRNKIAKALGVSPSKCQRTLKQYEEDRLIEQRMGRQSRLITMLTGGNAAENEQFSEQPANNQRTTKWHANEQPTEQRVWRQDQPITILSEGNTTESEQPSEQPANSQRTASEQPANTIRRIKDIKNNNTNIRSNELQNEFNELWQMYPRKQGKANAYRHYEKARKAGTTYEEVESGIKAYAAYAKHTEAQYVKMGSTFFSQRAWEDDWTIPKDKPKSKSNVTGQIEPPKYPMLQPDPEKETEPMPEDMRRQHELNKRIREIF